MKKTTTFSEPPRNLVWSHRMDTEIKRPAEVRKWTWDFSREPEITGSPALTITSVQSITVTTLSDSSSGGDVQPTVGSGTISSDGTKVYAFISGGTDGNQYQFDCLVKLSDGESYLNRRGVLQVSSTADIKI